MFLISKDKSKNIIGNLFEEETDAWIYVTTSQQSRNILFKLASSTWHANIIVIDGILFRDIGKMKVTEKGTMSMSVQIQFLYQHTGKIEKAGIHQGGVLGFTLIHI